MFFGKDRIVAVRERSLGNGRSGGASREAPPMQRGDFLEILRVMDGLPVTIRLLDPPLHEFLPKDARPSARSRRKWK